MLNPELEQLVALADLDDEIARHQKARADALAAVPTADKVVAAAVAAHDAAKAALAAHAPKESAIDRQMDDYKVQRGRAVRALETGMGDAAAAERQQAQCEAILDRLETELLGLFEVRDGLEQAVASTSAAIDAARKKRDEIAAAAAPALAAADAALARLTPDRDAARAAVPAPELGRYDALRSRQRRPVARIDGDTCSACNRVVVPHQQHEIARGRLVTCAGCNRWLYPAA
jgi:predicted  nucleic acid-binding Zn-ribbon protein